MREYMVCRNCNLIFDVEDAPRGKEYHGELTQDGHRFYEEFIACPHCGSDDIDTARICALCGTPYDDTTDLCPKCRRRIKDAKNWLLNEIIDELFYGDESEQADALNAVEEAFCE